MTNKSAIIKSREHGPDEVEVQLDLCTYYRGIVVELPVEADDKFRSYVDVLVWGSLYIEAAINKTLTMAIEDSVHGILAPEDVVGPLERSGLEKKATLLLNKLCNDAEQKLELRRATTSLFELRNRLVHSKEKPESASLTISNPEEIRAAIEAGREHESTLEASMYKLDLKKRKQQILEIGGWFESSIFEYYNRKDA